jgi:hypothetical protein
MVRRFSQEQELRLLRDEVRELRGKVNNLQQLSEQWVMIFREVLKRYRIRHKGETKVIIEELSKSLSEYLGKRAESDDQAVDELYNQVTKITEDKHNP